MRVYSRFLFSWAASFMLSLSLVVPPPSSAQQPNGKASSADLTAMKIEDLMQLEVTSVSKKEQKVSQVAAAIFVITQDDIQHSGATNIPDLLRMVPGLDVAQINANTWAISARGFNSEFSNKLLVLIDGRAIYTPTLGAVYWDTVDLPLEDIDRIEVSRGPGGTIWGANAVNGVINIITKKSSDTPGGLLDGGGGTQQRAFGTAQYGGTFAHASSSYRIFSKYSDADHLPDLDGDNGFDGWRLLHGGFRVDASVSAKDQLTFEGDLYTGSEGAIIAHTILNPPENLNLNRIADLSGGTFLSRWDHSFSDRSSTSLQISYDTYTRSGPQAYEERGTFDLDFQHHIALSARHDLIWGAEVRTSPDHTIGTIDQGWVPADRTFNLYSAFLQDEITLRPNRLFFTVGSKLENTNFSAFNAQPAARLAWTPSPRRTVWTAVSVAYRTPTRRDQNINAALAALPGPAEVLLTGNPDFQSERVVALEAGYRMQVSSRLSFDVAGFFNSYSNLESLDTLAPYVQPGSNPPLTVNQILITNDTTGHTGGVEVFANWKITRRWTLSPGYARLDIVLHNPTDVATDAQGADPPNEAQLRSHLELGHRLSWDLNAYFLDNPPSQFIPGTTRLDSQLTWHTGERSQVSVVGQNLLRDHHLEFNDPLQAVNSSLVKRGVLAKFQWWF